MASRPEPDPINARLYEQIADIPLVDHHCHAPRRRPQALEASMLRAPFTESTDETVQLRDVPQTLVYRGMIRRLARLLGCEPDEQSVLEARAGIEEERYHRLLADDAGLEALFDDYLFDEPGSYGPQRWAALTGRPVRPVLRIETFAERLLASATDWESFRQQFRLSLAASPSGGVVAFKSIAAYRAGLDVQRVDAESASRAFDEVRASIESRSFTRLTSKPLIDALIWETLEVAAEVNMPLQFHVGLGDDDVYLPSSNPALLRTIFQESRYRDVPIVLLHNHPFIRQSAYLASIYPNAYVDLGLTIPLASTACAPLVRQALGLAPTNKVLASSDGHGVPEFQWYSAHVWRASLAGVLAAAVHDDFLGEDEAVAIASQVLRDNANALYSGAATSEMDRSRL